MAVVNDIKEKMEALMDAEIRPSLWGHQGNIVIQSITEGVVHLQMSGRCSGCPSALTVTGECIREKILAAFPQIQTVIFNCVSEDLLQQARNILRRSDSAGSI
ncbi:NifU family protein [Megasphaera cerevisiae]|jgi:Fe-S cluster biogenesis protein NfuA|uniref:NifU family protein n=1 Tax=Megasphaera cerevisiae TaxID=39029 RepID=UPI0009423A31|nr:NifU family protein [Megasphaera cerevisiae]MCI1751190.1 NifU family protein [Megasphaera cerevisiae]OKY53983.1 hypothetical protein BSR42_04765 [Megasphaera cerevisiae]